jgi:hypothetical protein
LLAENYATIALQEEPKMAASNDELERQLKELWARLKEVLGALTKRVKELEAAVKKLQRPTKQQRERKSK